MADNSFKILTINNKEFKVRVFHGDDAVGDTSYGEDAVFIGQWEDKLGAISQL